MAIFGAVAKIAKLPGVDQLTDAWAMSVAGPFGPAIKDFALGMMEGQDPMEALKGAGMGMLQGQLGGFGGQVMKQLGIDDPSSIGGFDDFFSIAKGRLPELTEEQGLGLFTALLQAENGEQAGGPLSDKLLEQLRNGDTGSAIFRLEELFNLGNGRRSANGITPFNPNVFG